MRILYISGRQCRPATSGGKIRDYWLAHGLGSAAELTYVYYPERGRAGIAAADLPFCKRIVPVPRPQPYSPAKIVQGLAGRWPLPVANYTSTEMIAALRALLAESRFDVVHLDSIHLAACVSAVRRELKGTPVMYGWHDITSEQMWRYAEVSKSQGRRFYARYTARRLEQAERSILRSAQGHIVCSERERTELLKRAPEARIGVVENGIDTEAFSPAEAGENPRRIVYVGAMHYHANIDAALWFARQVWPGIQKQFPELIFTVVGADPKPEVLGLREVPGIEVTGTVESVAPYYREALMAVVPLRVGTGTRLKIPEAMACGVPVISTQMGAEGLEVTPGKHLLIAGNEQEWRSAIELLHGCAERRRELAVEGRKLVCARYDWRAIGRGLAELYTNWLAALPSGKDAEAR